MRRASALLERLAAPPARTTQERYRHELKYLINEGEHVALACRMAPVFKLDKHAQAVFSCAKSIACASITAATR